MPVVSTYQITRRATPFKTRGRPPFTPTGLSAGNKGLATSTPISAGRNSVTISHGPPRISRGFSCQLSHHCFGFRLFSEAFRQTRESTGSRPTCVLPDDFLDFSHLDSTRS